MNGRDTKKSLHFVSGKTAKSILISYGARLALFDIAELRELTEDDELQHNFLALLHCWSIGSPEIHATLDRT